MTMVFLLTGASSFPNPGNWNPTNTVEVVGCGSYSSRGRTMPPCPTYVAGWGGAGGGYGRGNNRADPFPVALLITASNNGTIYSGTPYFSNWADPGGGAIGGNQYKGAVWAGNAASNGAGNAAASGQPGGPDAGYAGGAGGNFGGTTGYYGAGGGGAAGPHGAGGNGTNATNATTTGGASDGGTVAGATGASGAGRSGTQWDASHGTGSGGSGGTGTAAGGTGGQYGGGAGGNGNTNGATTSGGDAIIVLTYTPYVAPPPSAFAQIIV